VFGDTLLIEMKGATFDIRSEPLSGADPLNHIEWRGSVIIKMVETVPYRMEVRSNGAWGEWDEWKVGGDGLSDGTFEFVKKDDSQWFFVSNDGPEIKYIALKYFLAEFPSPSCSDAM
jgi:hypothetical protein